MTAAKKHKRWEQKERAAARTLLLQARGFEVQLTQDEKKLHQAATTKARAAEGEAAAAGSAEADATEAETQPRPRRARGNSL